MPSSDEFFIGWLPLPPSYRRVARFAAAACLALAIGAAALISAQQASSGSGRWDADRVITLEGVVTARPYALLHVRAVDAQARPQTVLLVSSGKFGAAERALPFAGKLVRVRGTRIQRDGRAMLELVDEPLAIELLEPPSHAPPHTPLIVRQGSITLAGEIIDPKCYLGAMKPGGGKTHKACAALCLAGGVPPMFVTRGSVGQETYYLLVTTAGDSAAELAIPWVGEPVEVTAEAETWGDLAVLRIRAGGVSRRK